MITTIMGAFAPSTVRKLSILPSGSRQRSQRSRARPPRSETVAQEALRGEAVATGSGAATPNHESGNPWYGTAGRRAAPQGGPVPARVHRRGVALQGEAVATGKPYREKPLPIGKQSKLCDAGGITHPTCWTGRANLGSLWTAGGTNASTPPRSWRADSEPTACRQRARQRARRRGDAGRRGYGRGGVGRGATAGSGQVGSGK
jgi:hypothetical protein